MSKFSYQAMDFSMPLLQEVKFAVGQINKQGNNALQRLEILLKRNPKEAFILEIKCLVEDILNHLTDPPQSTAIKRQLLGSVFHKLFTQRPETVMMVKTAFDMVDLPPGGSNFLQNLFTVCEFDSELCIWICICTNSCNKQAIQQDANKIIMGMYPSINQQKIRISSDLFAAVQTIVYTKSQRSQKQSYYTPDTPQQVSTPKSPVSPLPNELESKYPIASHLGKICGQLGAVISTSENALRFVFSLIPKDQTFGLDDLLCMLLVIGNYEMMSVSIQRTPDVADDIQLLLKQCPELRTPNTESIQWDFSLFASVLKSVFPSFSFTDLFASLDDPLFTIQRPEAFSFIYRMYCYVAGDILPSSLLYKPWKNIQQQIQFLNMLMFIDVSAFTKTSTQITIPDIFLGDVQSCWTSMDLLKIVLTLIHENQSANILISDHAKTAGDVTVLMIALVQLDGEWDETRKDVMCRVLMAKTMSLKQRKEQIRSLTTCMQPFITKYPEVCSECILKTYYSSFSKPECYPFFNLLFEACYSIPAFIPLLKKIVRVPIYPNLCLLVHTYYLEALLYNDIQKLESQMRTLLDNSKLNLVSLLMDLLDKYSTENNTLVLDRPQLVKWTRGFLESIISEKRIPENMEQRYSMIVQRIDSREMGANQNPVMRLVQQYIVSQSLEERKQYMLQINQIVKSPDGLPLLSRIVNNVVVYLSRLDNFQDNEVMNIVSLIIFFANNDLLSEKHYIVVLKVVSTLLDNNPNSDFYKLGYDMIVNLASAIQRNSAFIQYIVSSQPTAFSPVLIDLLQKILSEGQMVMNHMKEAVSPVAMPSMPSQPTELQPTFTKEQLVVAKKHQQEIMQNITPVPEEVVEKVPDERVKNRVSVLINNITNANIGMKIDDIVSLIQGYEKWFADMLVRSRVERQNNYHELYLDLVDRLVQKMGPVIMDEVMHSSLQVTKELLSADYSVFVEKHSFLKIMGEWLGTVTIGRDICLSQYHVNLSQQLYIAFYHKRLLYVYEFVCFVLRSCKKSKVLHPPQPWLMSLLSLLKEIREIPGIINKIGYLYDNFLSNNGYIDSEIVVQQSELYLAIPEVANNNDFSETANQSEVYAYFQARYPQLNELSSPSEGTLKSLMNTKNSYHEFYPKVMSPISLPTPQPTVDNPIRQPQQPAMNTPASTPNGPNGPNGPAATSHDDRNVSIGIPASLQQSLQPAFLVKLHKMIENVMRSLVNTYSKLIGMVHEKVVCNSLLSMYYRDFVEIKDIEEIMNCLQKPALTLVQSLLFISAKDLEREFIVQMDLYNINRSYVSDAQIEEIVKMNIQPLLKFIQLQLVDRILITISREIQEDNRDRLGLKQRQENSYFQSFMKTEGIQRNEIICDGVFTMDQKSVYTQFINAPSMNDAVLSDAELHQVTIEVAYDHIKTLIRNILTVENGKDVWNTQFELSVDCASAYPELLSFFDTIKGNHIKEEDRMLIGFLRNIVSQMDFFKEFHQLVVIVKLAQFLDSQDVCDYDNQNNKITISDIFSSLLCNIDPTEQPDFRISFFNLLATNHLLNVKIFDEAFASLITKTYPVVLDSVIRFVSTCLNDLMIIHEAILPSEIPLTLKEIEKCANYDMDTSKSTELAKNSFCPIWTAIQKKIEILKQREIIQTFMKSKVYKDFEKVLLQFIGSYDLSNNGMSLLTQLNEIVSYFDIALKTLPEKNIYSILYAIFDSVYSNFYQKVNMPQKPSLTNTALVSFFSALLKRENKENRFALSSIIFSAFRSFFFTIHDVYKESFVPAYFSSFLYIWLKQIILEEKEKETRQQYLIDFMQLFSDLLPQNAPLFIVVWIQLLSSPQLMSVLLGEKNETLQTMTGDLIIRLLSFCQIVQQRDLQEITQKLVDRVNFLIRIILTSFPGFLCHRCYEIIPYVIDDLRPKVLNDCPPEFTAANASVEELCKISVETTMAYKQELTRFGLIEYLDKIMLQQSLEQSLYFVIQTFMIHDNRAKTLLRAIIHYWILEEENIISKATDASTTLSASDCILLLLSKNLNTKVNSYQISVMFIIDYIRFPCKETQLFRKAFLGMYSHVDKEIRMLMNRMIIDRLNYMKSWGLIETYKSISYQ